MGAEGKRHPGNAQDDETDHHDKVEDTVQNGKAVINGFRCIVLSIHD
jgi:hypothetical protein